MKDDAPVIPSQSFLTNLKTFKYSSPPKRTVNSLQLEAQTSTTPAIPPLTPSKRPKLTPGRYKKGVKKSYAAPSQYAHLNGLPDRLVPGLDILWCGINPGVKSAEIGHSFGNPTNRFWTYLYKSGLTEEKLKPEADATLPETHKASITNLIERPTGCAAELDRSEYMAGVPSLLRKLLKYKPKILVLLGKTIFTTLDIAVAPPSKKSRSSRSPHFDRASVKPPPFAMGLQRLLFTYPDLEDGSSTHTFLFALPSPSGLETHYQGAPAIALFAQVKAFRDQLVADPRYCPTDLVMHKVDVAKWLQEQEEALPL